LKQSIEWDRYARSYDVLADNNPSYQENIELIEELFAKLNLAEGSRVCDIGAGTGNFLARLAPKYPEVRFIHLDSSAEMNSAAQRKYDSLGAYNVEIVEKSVFEHETEVGSFDVLICINALYAMRPQHSALERMYSWLKDEGTLLIIDFGRPTKIVDWARFLVSSTFKKRGWSGVFNLITTGFGSIIQNRKGAKGQGDGGYWLHSTNEFGECLSSVGFKVDLLRACYREYCDVAVCCKEPTPSP